MEQKEYLIIYHREDNDGLFSAGIFYDYLINKMNLKLEDLCFIGGNYNSLSEFAKENTPKKLHEDFKHIIMTDISFNDPKYMKGLWDEFKYDFIWCDHHAPIIKASFEKKRKFQSYSEFYLLMILGLMNVKDMILIMFVM